jgi:hypothetical protein
MSVSKSKRLARILLERGEHPHGKHDYDQAQAELNEEFHQRLLALESLAPTEALAKAADATAGNLKRKPKPVIPPAPVVKAPDTDDEE